MKAVLLAGLTIAAPVAAMDPILNLPIDCTLGDSCYIQFFVDNDPTAGVRDFACGTTTYDTHKGVDFALPSLAEMDTGVDVLAAAPGRVVATRDGMPDRIHSAEFEDEITGRECGNGVVVDHGRGWQTQYCHLEQGSVIVEKGTRVGTGTPLGMVGLSGKTQFPHVHFVVRHRGEIVDPFSPDGRDTCSTDASARTLWESAVDYTSGGPISVGFSTGVPDYADVKAGTAHSGALPTDAPALVIWGFFHNGQVGDQIALVIDGPDGVLFDTIVSLEKAQPLFFRAGGKRRTNDGWTKGVYHGIAQLIRNGEIIGTDGITTEIQ